METAMIISETSFTQAVAGFKEFLKENNLPTEILWLFSEDVFSRNVKYYEKEFWVKPPLPEENETLAEIHYKIGQQKNLGIGLSAFALCEDKICCSFIIPKDEEDSEYLFMSPKYLKLSFVIDMPTAIAVKNPFRWFLFKLFPFKFKQGIFLAYLESRRNLQFSGV
jgi:hypothetical protein